MSKLIQNDTKLLPTYILLITLYNISNLLEIWLPYLPSVIMNFTQAIVHIVLINFSILIQIISREDISCFNSGSIKMRIAFT